MDEIEQIKRRINDARMQGVDNACIRDDYEPVGGLILNTLTNSGEYVQRKTPPGSFNQRWKIFKKGCEPY